MMPEKKRKVDSLGELKVSDTPMGQNARLATIAAKRPVQNRVALEENSFSRSQEDCAEHYTEEILNEYLPDLTNNDLSMFVLYEVRKLMEEVNAKYCPGVGDVFVTGLNDSCQLGTASSDQVCRLTCFRDLHGMDIVHATCGSLSNFVLDRLGRVYSWGSSDKGALARRTDTIADPETEYKAERITGFNPSKLGPVKIPASNEDSNILQVAAGGGHVLFLTNNGAVYVAGSYLIDNKAWREEPPPDQPDKDNTVTELYEGAAPLGYREEPRHVYRMPQPVEQIYAGTSMSAARLIDGTLVTWGFDVCGELGRGNSAQQCLLVTQPTNSVEREQGFKLMKDDFLHPKPVKFSNPIGKHVVHDVACGQNHMLVVLRVDRQSQTQVYATGLNQYGQLGLGDTTNRNVLTLIPDSLRKNIISVSAGIHHSMFLDVTGRNIYTCGRSDSGQLGLQDTIPDAGDYINAMQLLPFDRKDPDEDLHFKQIAAGENSSFAVTRTGKLYSWGFGEMGQLGHGKYAEEPRATPVQKFAKGDSGFVLEVASGSQHTVVLADRVVIQSK